MELWAENFVPDIEDPRLIVKDWNQINPRFDEFVSLIESITDNWKITNQPNILYEAGTWGPGDTVLDEGTTWVTKSWKE
jgi:hypothetical protein